MGPIVAGMIGAASLLVVGTGTAQAAAKSGDAIAHLAMANMGRHACARNSLGGRGYGSSCTGNGGRPEYWCADFAKWVWQHSGVANTAELTPAAGSFYTYGLRNGTLTGTPAVGDAAVFNYYGSGVAEHVAIVTQVNPDGTVETTSGDWAGHGGTEAAFASTSRVVLNDPPYPSTVGKVPLPMGMVLSGFVAPVGVPVTPVIGGTQVTENTTLTTGETVTSPNGLFSLGVTPTGALVEHVGSRAVWSTGGTPLPGDRAVLQSDGNFVLYNPTGQAIWSTRTAGSPGDSLWVRNNGSLVITASDGTVIFQRTPSPQVLRPGVTLMAGQKLVVEGGLYQIDMQVDGNVVEYSGGRALWVSRTGHHAGAHLIVYPKGRMAVVAKSGAVLKLWGRQVAGDMAQLLGNGELVLRVGNAVLWSNGV